MRDPDIVIRTRLRSGQFVYHEGSLLCGCAGGSVLGVSRVVLPFKDVQTAHHFHRDQCRGVREFHKVYNPGDGFHESVVGGTGDRGLTSRGVEKLNGCSKELIRTSTRESNHESKRSFNDNSDELCRNTKHKTIC